MTTPAQDQYVTREELAARLAELELRIVERLAALERRIDDQFRTQTRWIIGLIVPLYAVLLVMIVTVFNRLP